MVLVHQSVTNVSVPLLVDYTEKLATGNKIFTIGQIQSSALMIYADLVEPLLSAL